MLPLHHACWKGQTQAAEFLLDNGTQLAEADSSLKTALHWAVQFGHYETLITLLKVWTVLNILQKKIKEKKNYNMSNSQTCHIIFLVLDIVSIVRPCGNGNKTKRFYFVIKK